MNGVHLIRLNVDGVSFDDRHGVTLDHERKVWITRNIDEAESVASARGDSDNRERRVSIPTRCATEPVDERRLGTEREARSKASSGVVPVSQGDDSAVWECTRVSK